MPVSCPVCLTSNRDAAHYCVQCGTSLEGEATLLGTGTTLQGRYQIQHPVVTTHSRVIYKGNDTRLGKMVAIKSISAYGLTSEELHKAVAIFDHEFAILSLLTHPNLPRVIDHFEERGKQYLIMDFVEGESLENQIADRGRQPFPEPQVVEWAATLCDLLAYLHNQVPPVIFRDLSPSNIIVQTDKRLKLVGFGIARLFKHNQGQDTSTYVNPGYSAPEQHTDARSDLYSLGVVMHELLTGSDPRQTPVLIPARQMNPLISERIEAVIQKATRPRPNERYQSAQQMKADLLGIPEPRTKRRWTLPASLGYRLANLSELQLGFGILVILMCATFLGFGCAVIAWIYYANGA